MKKISIKKFSINLRNFVDEISQYFGVDLQVDEKVKDLNLQCLITEKTLEEVKSIISTWLPGKWVGDLNNTVIMHSDVYSQKKQWWNLFNAVFSEENNRYYENILKKIPKNKSFLENKIPKENINALKESYIFNPLSIYNGDIPIFDKFFKKFDGPSLRSEPVFIFIPFSEIDQDIYDIAIEICNDFNNLKITRNDNKAGMFFYFATSTIYAGVLANSRIIGSGASLSSYSDNIVSRLNQSNLSDLIEKYKIKNSNYRKLAYIQKNKIYKKDEIPYNQIYKYPIPFIPGIISGISDKIKINYICDVYSQPFEIKSVESTVKFLKNVDDLSKFVGKYDYSCDMQDNCVLIRNNRWYRDDELEVPKSILESIRKMINDNKHPLDVSDFINSKLTKFQIINGLYYNVDYDMMNIDLKKNKLKYNELETTCQKYCSIANLSFLYPKTSRFYASLDGKLQGELSSSAGLSVRTLGGQQREMLFQVLPDLSFQSMTESARLKLSWDSVGLSIVPPDVFGSGNVVPAALPRLQYADV